MRWEKNVFLTEEPTTKTYLSGPGNMADIDPCDFLVGLSEQKNGLYSAFAENIPFSIV